MALKLLGFDLAVSTAQLSQAQRYLRQCKTVMISANLPFVKAMEVWISRLGEVFDENDENE